MSESTIGVTNRCKTWGFIVNISLLESSLSMNERMLYIALFSFLGKEGDSCYPSIKKIEKRCACSKATVFRTLNELEKKEIVKRIHRFDRETGRQTSTMYEIFDIPELYLGGGSQIETGIKCASEEVGSQAETGRVSQSDGGGSQIETQKIYQKEDIPKEQKDKDTLIFDQGPQRDFVPPPDEAHKKSEVIQESLPLTETKTERESRNPSENVPICMRQVADYFLLKTGRGAVSPEDVEILKELARNHTPMRVLKEIDIAVNRALTRNKSPCVIQMSYIGDSLKNQKSIPKSVERYKRSESDEKAEEEKQVLRIMDGHLNNLVIAYTDCIFTPERIWDTCERLGFSEELRSRLRNKMAEIDERRAKKVS